MHIIAEEMFDHISSGMIGVREDAEVARLTRATTGAVVELILTMMEHGIPPERAEAPVIGIEHARAIADRGRPIEDLLRYYRLGHACFTHKWAEAIVELAYDPAELINVLRETDAFVFTFVDVICSGVSAAYVDERERVHRRVAAERRDVTRMILDGQPVDVGLVERTLGHPLHEPQLAFICWTNEGLGRVEQAAAALQEGLGARCSLVLLDERTVWGWFATRRSSGTSTAAVAGAVAAAAPDVHVALGPVIPGIEGFRRSRLCVERVRRIVTLAGRPPPTLTSWEDVALADALAVDPIAARELVRAELGELSRVGESYATLRETARTFVVHGFSYASVASTLKIHRNTALQRIRKAESLRGAPLTHRPGELLAALAVVEAVGLTVLSQVAGQSR